MSATPVSPASPYPTKQQIDAEVLRVLRNAEVGKDVTKTPKLLSAHQIGDRMAAAIASPIVAAGGVGGAGNGYGGGQGTPLSMVVQHSCRRLARKGMVRIRYLDCGGIVFKSRWAPTGEVTPSFPVIGLYQYVSSVPSHTGVGSSASAENEPVEAD
jgi:hypothetical protein